MRCELPAPTLSNGGKHEYAVNAWRVDLDMGCHIGSFLRRLQNRRCHHFTGDPMTYYYIIRTRPHKEQVVEAAIQRMGYTAWCPMEVRAYRTAAMRKTRQTGVKEAPAMPKVLLSAIPEAVHGNLHLIRDFVRVDCDAACTPLKIPGSHIEAFFETLDEWNDKERRRIMRGNRGKPEKKKWQKLEPATLGAVMAEMFGTAQQEIAA